MHGVVDVVDRALAILLDSSAGRRRQDGSAAASHPLLACCLLRLAGETEPAMLAAALLHDVLEDAKSEPEHWRRRMASEVGTEVAGLVEQLTDQPTLHGDARRGHQLLRLAHAGRRVQAIKLADRLANVMTPSPLWSPAKQQCYRLHSLHLLALCRDANPRLAAWLHDTLHQQPWGPAGHTA